MQMFIVASFLLLVALHQTSALKCYDCTKTYNVDSKAAESNSCPEDYDKFNSITCSADQVCYKVETEDKITKKLQVTRGCNTKTFCKLYENKKDANCYTCDSDECNPADRAQTSLLLTGLSAIALALRY